MPAFLGNEEAQGRNGRQVLSDEVTAAGRRAESPGRLANGASPTKHVHALLSSVRYGMHTDVVFSRWRGAG